MSATPELNPDGPHSPERTAEVGSLFDDASRFLTYATMAGKGGLRFPADAYRLLADLYSATGRLPQLCVQLVAFLAAQEESGTLYDARGRDVGEQVAWASHHLGAADAAAGNLTRALQEVQNAIAGLGVKNA